jgi:crotonobetainyl-CoA:carnitine CoA-transferase CaiB-like acyl-CoA transferase
MTKPLAGIRVVEVAAWTFVPAAGAILADLGADVVKVEPPSGDPQRALKNRLQRADAANPFLEIPNHGKRSIIIDLTAPQGREVLLSLVPDQLSRRGAPKAGTRHRRPAGRQPEDRVRQRQRVGTSGPDGR